MAYLKMKSPEGTVSVCLGGQSYEANKRGVVEVPAEYEDTMYSFGFVTIGKNIPAEPEIEESATPVPAAAPVQEIVPATAEDPEASKVEAVPETEPVKA